MRYLVASILCSVAVANLFKALERRSVPLHRVLLVNYIAATVIAFSRAASVGWGTVEFDLPSPPKAGLFLVSVAAGCLFIGSYYLLDRAMRRLGIGISISMMRLSAVIPVGASILLFSEVPTGAQTAGLALALLILPLASPGNGTGPYTGAGPGVEALDAGARPSGHGDAIGCGEAPGGPPAAAFG